MSYAEAYQFLRLRGVKVAVLTATRHLTERPGISRSSRESRMIEYQSGGPSINRSTKIALFTVRFSKLATAIE